MQRVLALVALVLLTACGGSGPTGLAPSATEARPSAPATRTAPAVPTAPPAARAPSTTARVSSPRATAPPAARAPSTTARVSSPRATADPRPMVVARNVDNYRDADGLLWFLGELVNTGQVDAGNAQVVISLVDADGRTLASGTGNEGLTILAPGAQLVWKAPMSSSPATWHEARIRVEAEPVPEYARALLYPDLRVDNFALTPPADADSWIKAGGQIVNTGSSAAKNVKVTIGLYDAAGKLVAVGEGYPHLSQVPAGLAVPFSVEFVGLRELPPRHEVYITGQR